MNERQVDILVIGAGPAGLAAAISAKESGIDSLLVVEREKDAATAEAGEIVKDYQDQLQREDDLKPEEITGDIEILKSGVPLTKRDVMAILERNQDNKTMTQLALRYADNHGIETGVRYRGNQQTIKDAESANYIVHLYVDHWIDRDQAGDVLEKFFGGVINE